MLVCEGLRSCTKGLGKREVTGAKEFVNVDLVHNGMGVRMVC